MPAAGRSARSSWRWIPKTRKKDIGRLDIELPVLAPRIYREYKNLNELDVAALSHKKLPVEQFSEEEQREIVFRNIDTELKSHRTVLESMFEPNYQNVIGYFTRTIMRDLRFGRRLRRAVRQG